MVFYVVTRKHSYTMKAYAQCWDGMRLLFYDDLFQTKSLPVGAYIFTDLDRLTAIQRQLAVAAWRQLAAHTPRVMLLNDPASVLCRYELMCELANAGENHYRARRLTDGLNGLHYPVFIRSEREHKGSITPLLHSSTAVRRALLWARIEGYRARDLLVVEFCDTSDAAGLFRKYSAFMVGDEVLPRHLLVGRKWHLKKPDLADVDTAREVQIYLERNPHEEAIRRIFSRAKIDYGRIDYSLAGEQIQVWEINTNPMVRKRTERLTAAFARLNMGLSNDLLPIPIQLDSSLLTAAERESHREMRALHTRDRRRANVAGLVGFARPFRLAARLLRGY